MTPTVFALSLLFLPAAAPEQAPQTQPPTARRLRVFLDCTECYPDYLRSEITFVDYVRDRTEADVHLLITRSSTGGGGREYNVELIGVGRFAGAQQALKAVTTASDTDDTIRRQIANTVRVGLLAFLARDGVPPDLDLTVTLGRKQVVPSPSRDRWNFWVFSLRGEASVDGEESQREMQYGGSISADRITPDWKITLGGELDHERERFNLDEEDEPPLEVERRERDFNWLVVKGFGEHWSAGGRGEVLSSTFENTELAIAVSPAVEYNLFPYSEYTRRQLRFQYSIGPRWANYYEQTLFGVTEETRIQHEVSAAYDQRERWGSLDARVEWSQYLHDLDLYRLEVDGDISLRIARGLSVSIETNASRIRDQLSLPARGATPEEVLLRLRELQSGYEYSFSFGLTYTFGSIFSSIVNPRFGQ